MTFVTVTAMPVNYMHIRTINLAAVSLLKYIFSWDLLAQILHLAQAQAQAQARKNLQLGLRGQAGLIQAKPSQQ